MKQPKRNSVGLFRCFDPTQMRVCVGNTKDDPITSTSIINIKNSSGETKEVFLEDIQFTTNNKNYYA